MALIILQYGLPILLGYTFFVGLAGRYNPFARPKARLERPSWFLGLWTGITIAAIALVGLRVAFRMDLTELTALVAPIALAFAASMVPGLIAYFWYRSHVKRQVLNTEAVVEDQFSDSQTPADLELDKTLSLETVASIELDDTVPVRQTDILDIDAQSGIWANAMDQVKLAESR